MAVVPRGLCATRSNAPSAGYRARAELSDFSIRVRFRVKHGGATWSPVLTRLSAGRGAIESRPECTFSPAQPNTRSEARPLPPTPALSLSPRDTAFGSLGSCNSQRSEQAADRGESVCWLERNERKPRPARGARGQGQLRPTASSRIQWLGPRGVPALALARSVQLSLSGQRV